MDLGKRVRTVRVIEPEEAPNIPMPQTAPAVPATPELVPVPVRRQQHLAICI